MFCPVNIIQFVPPSMSWNSSYSSTDCHLDRPRRGLICTAGLLGIHREDDLDQFTQGTRQVTIGQRIANLPALIGRDDQPTAP